MAEFLIQDTTLDAIADAINAKTGGSSAMTPAQMVTEIGNIPSGTTITDGIVIKARNANGYATEIELVTSNGKIYPNQLNVVNANNSPISYTWRYVERINFSEEITEVGNSALSGVPADFVGFDFSKLTNIGNYAFLGCSNLAADIVLKDDAVYGKEAFNISAITGFSWGFNGALPNNFLASCRSLAHVSLPKITRLGSFTSSIFTNCTALETVLLGGVGYGVTRWGVSNFQNCTQTGLTVTAYTDGSHVDGLLANIRDGATNATIIIKASENTTYNGASYAAGDTILTSEVTA